MAGTIAGMSLVGRIALVSGGGSGIGKAVCKALSREGASVLIADKNKESAVATLKDLSGTDERQHQALEVDVGNSESVSQLFAEIGKLYSVPASIVVNCAGIVRDGFLLEMTETAFDDVSRINLKGTYLVTQAAAQQMVAKEVKEGSIVNISSIVGKTGNMGQCNYAASKAGVVGFTKTVALELARHNIRCNAVMPGFIDTPMVAGVPERVMAKLVPRIPMGRTGTPEEVAEAVLFLCSPRSSYVTGSVLEVTGGLFM